MKRKLTAILGIGITSVFILSLLGMPGCAPTIEGIKKAPKKARPKVARQNALFSCSMAGLRKSCVAVSPTPVKPKKGAKILIAGSGFKPKQELGIRLVMGGVLSDISFMVKPRPVVNKFGAFASTWKLRGREFKRKLLQPGMTYTVTVVDEHGNTLGTAPLVFEKAKKKGKKKKK
ncbi:MAG: hypothetical protein ACE5JU_14635 [Candidatus Binatia bacterium]